MHLFSSWEILKKVVVGSINGSRNSTCARSEVCTSVYHKMPVQQAKERKEEKKVHDLLYDKPCHNRANDK